MSTPVLGPGPSAGYQAPPPDQSHDFGWLISTAAAIGLLIASWTVFGTDANGMWAGYVCEGLAALVLLSVSLLRTNISRLPFLGLILLCGVGLVVFGLMQIGKDGPIAICEITFGALMIVGAGLQTA